MFNYFQFVVLSQLGLQILIDNKQYYKFMGKDINMISLIKLDIEDGKIVRHQDWYAYTFYTYN